MTHRKVQAQITAILEGEKTFQFKDLEETFGEYLPLLGELHHTPQDPDWHAEGNVALHTAMVLEQVQNSFTAEITKEERLTLILAGLFHDIAKPMVTKHAEVKGEQRIVSPRHAELGRDYLALRLPQFELSTALQDALLSLVGYHHEPRSLVLGKGSRGAYAKLARMVDLGLVMALEKADLRGRICQDLEGQLEQLEWFRLQAEEFELEAVSDVVWQTKMREAFPRHSDAFVQHAAWKGRRDFEEGRIVSVEEAISRAYQLRETPAVLTLMVGPSGSGKSSWIEENRKGQDVVSLDHLREKIAGKRHRQSMNGQVLQAAKEALRVSLRAGRSVIWDATNLRKDGRRWVASLGYEYGAYVRIVTFRNSIETLQLRNLKRENSIPCSVLQRQIDGFQWPSLDEAHEVIFSPN